MPENTDMLFKILDKINDVSERCTKLEADNQIIKDSLKAVERQDEIQNKLLDDHIKGVQTAQARLDNEIQARIEYFVNHEQKSEKRVETIYNSLSELSTKIDSYNTRIENVESIPTFLENIKKASIWITSISTAVAAVTKVFGLW